MATKTEKYPELNQIARQVANETCKAINAAVPGVESKMPYKAQWVLEEVIEILQARV